jgi:hypothetical protein
MGKHTNNLEITWENTHKLRNLTGKHTNNLDSEISLESTHKQLRNLIGKLTETMSTQRRRYYVAKSDTFYKFSSQQFISSA